MLLYKKLLLMTFGTTLVFTSFVYRLIIYKERTVEKRQVQIYRNGIAKMRSNLQGSRIQDS